MILFSGRLVVHPTNLDGYKVRDFAVVAAESRSTSSEAPLLGKLLTRILPRTCSLSAHRKVLNLSLGSAVVVSYTAMRADRALVVRC